MSGSSTITINLWLPIFTTLLLTSLGWYGWRQRNVPGALYFASGSLLAALWVAGSVLEMVATDPAMKVFWVRFQSVFMLPATTAVTCFIIEYTWPGRWLTRRNLALLSFVPLIFLALILTNDLHHLVLSSVTYQDGSVTNVIGPAGRLALAYVYGLSILEVYAFAWLFKRSPEHRWPVVIFVIGQYGARSIYLLKFFNIITYPVPLDVLAIAFVFLMYAIVLFGFRIFDPIPLARQTAIEQLHAGMLVLDTQGLVTSLNPSAEQILHTPAADARGRSARDFLPFYPDGPLPAPEEREIEFSLGTEAEPRHYNLAISPLKDWRGLEVGRLLLIRDVTEQKKAQALLMEQQRVVATLQERERLARELHDSLGQVLGYVSLQAQAIHTWVADGDLNTAESQLARLEAVAQEAHKELRESILSLKTGRAEQWSFFASLQQFLDSYQDHYAIHTDLVIPASLREDVFEPGAGFQLLRVIQEALANARRHGQARSVQVTFERRDGHVSIVVSDDGRGFNPDQLLERSNGHFGLAFMRERMVQIDGSLAIESQPGAGAQVLLEVPARPLTAPYPAVA
jgi:signal transduction histidine kinase